MPFVAAHQEVAPYCVDLHLAQLLEERVVLLEALLGGLEHRLRLLHFGPTFFTSCLKRFSPSSFEIAFFANETVLDLSRIEAEGRHSRAQRRPPSQA